MSKILFIYEKEIPTISLTKEMFSREVVEKLGMNVSFKKNTEVRNCDIANNDVFYFIRCNDYLSYKIAKKIRKSNGFIIAFCDDDLFKLPNDIPSIPSRKRYLKKIIQVSDVLLSSSQHFLNKYRNLLPNKRDVIINTIVDSNSFNERKDNDVLKILYAGSLTHLGIFNKLIKPTIGSLIEKYGKKISFTFIGVHPDLKEFEALTNIFYSNSLSLSEYRKYVYNGHFDIGLAPLFNDEFSKCKYFNKYLEYTMAGIVGLYSNVEPYTFVIKDGINGFLVNDGDWATKIEYILENKNVLNSCLNEAQQDVKNNFNGNVIFTRLLDDIPELKEYKKQRKVIHFSPLSMVFYFIHRFFDIIFVSLFYLFHGGIKVFLKKFKVHFKEKKSIKSGGK